MPEPTASDVYTLKIPPGFPVPEIPADNALTQTRVVLGKILFYDPILSSDSTHSCASCHLPQLAFSDSLVVSVGVKNRLGTRNTPSLANVAYQKRLLREGGLPSLEMQVLVPIQEHNEFDFNIVKIAERLNKSDQYRSLANRAYGRDPDPYVITRALSAFERTLLSGNSPYDQWAYQGKLAAFTAEAQRGYSLFQSEKLNCAQCHEGFLFTNQDFMNNGLYSVYPDSGRIRLTGIEADRALFKVPSLRNVALTAPYMHDGSLATLEAVIAHYESGGKNHPQKSKVIKAFKLTTQEKADLIAFLRALTDEKFISDPGFR